MPVLASSASRSYPVATGRPWAAVHEPDGDAAPRPRLLDRVREAIRARHYSRRTEKAYAHWIRRYIFLHGKRHPLEMGAAEVTAFLSALAVQGRVAPSTQNQALSALLFLYRDVLAVELPWLDDVVRAKRPQHLPVVLTRDEVRAVLSELDGIPRLMALLLYGAGLRLLECCHLRVKDIDVAANQIVVRDGKGGKDRVTMLPTAVKPGLAIHLEAVRAQHAMDFDAERAGSSYRARSPGSIRTPAASGDGSGCFRPRAITSIASPASAGATICTSRCCSAPSEPPCVPPGSPSRRPATSSATRSPPISWRTITTSGRLQELLGHRDVSTTMIYTHVLDRGAAGVQSPVDRMLLS